MIAVIHDVNGYKIKQVSNHLREKKVAFIIIENTDDDELFDLEVSSPTLAVREGDNLIRFSNGYEAPFLIFGKGTFSRITLM